MTQTGSEAHSDETPAPPAEAPAAADRSGLRRATAALAAALVLVVAGMALSPYWAPQLMPLLPWGGQGGVTHAEFAALQQHVAALDRQFAARSGKQDALAPRLGRVETGLGAAQQQLQQLTAQLAAAGRQQQARRDAADAASGQAQQQLARLDGIAGDLGKRVSALQQQVEAQRRTGRTAAPLLVALLQIREAVDAGRPFAADYAALAALAKDRPDIAAAAAPLAAAAADGAASRATLARRLAALADKLAAAAPAPASGWQAQALAQLRGLVTIRRLAGPGQSGPEAAVAAAQKALAAGDLRGAVAALASLTGGGADAVRPWRQLAQRRLAVEAALARLQRLLTAAIEAPAPKPAPAAAPPAKAPS